MLAGKSPSYRHAQAARGRRQISLQPDVLAEILIGKVVSEMPTARPEERLIRGRPRFYYRQLDVSNTLFLKVFRKK
jgi:hypothetical protein